MPSFEQSTGTSLKQQQSVVLSQKQLRSLELLHLPLQALESRLVQELTENPVPVEHGEHKRLNSAVDIAARIKEMVE